MSKKHPEEALHIQQFGIDFSKLTPEIVKDIMLIFAKSAAIQPEFYLDPRYTSDADSPQIPLAFNPENALLEIQEGFSKEPWNPVFISSFYSYNEEGVGFQLTGQQKVVRVMYEPGEWHHLLKDFNERDKRFIQALNAYLLGKNIAIPIR
jgi:hypothetical protein